MKTATSVRNPAMDIIRCFALLCVVSLHFLAYTDYYYIPHVGTRMYLMTLVHSICRICVPLFMMLSGYLLNKKQPVRSYYAKLGKTLSIYCLASICCYFYIQYFAPNAVRTFSFPELFFRILSFSTPTYSWYINMYLGLFLLIPYLNICFHSLPDAKSQRQLILSIIVLTALPNLVNAFYYADGLHFGGKEMRFDTILPNYWRLITPVAYYLLGAYLRLYPLKIKRLTNLLLIFVCVLITGTGVYLINYGGTYIFGTWQDWDALPSMILSILVFNYLAQGDYSRLRPGTCRLLSYLSDLCLGAFLVSWIFDRAFYRILDQIQPYFAYQIVYFPLMVAVVGLCSLTLSAVLNGLYTLIVRIFTKLLPNRQPQA